VYGLYAGLTNTIPGLGDSYDYHIPISKAILDGSILTLKHVPSLTPPYIFHYYPGASEAFDSLLILLHIPLTISNIIPVILLFFAIWKLCSTYKLNYYTGLLVASSFCSLNVIARWYNAVSIDVWMALFFVLTLILLEKPERTWKYFVALGITTGMIIGTKYSGVPILIGIGIVYGWRVLKHLSFPRLLAYLVPFTITGVSWYIRNYILMGNPFYPVGMFGFKGPHHQFDSVGTAFVHYPVTMANAYIGEYKAWAIAPFVALLIVGYWLWKRPELPPLLQIARTVLLHALIQCAFFLTYFTTTDYSMMVSSYRYSFSPFCILMIGIFLVAQQYKKEEWIAYFAIANILDVTTLPYLPKLAFIYIPVAFVAFYVINKLEPDYQQEKVLKR
jgi:hypothetical protein